MVSGRGDTGARPSAPGRLSCSVFFVPPVASGTPASGHRVGTRGEANACRAQKAARTFYVPQPGLSVPPILVVRQGAR